VPDDARRSGASADAVKPAALGDQSSADTCWRRCGAAAVHTEGFFVFWMNQVSLDPSISLTMCVPGRIDGGEGFEAPAM